MRRNTSILFAFILASAIVPPGAAAEELSLLVGRSAVRDTGEPADSWQVDFRYYPARYLVWSASYLNEGHVTGHKRDGVATQLWGRIPMYGRRIVVSLGAGPYRYFDTAVRPDGTFADLHGWAVVYSASAAYLLDSPWIVRLTANHIRGSGDVDMNTYVLGVGYRLWKGVETEPETSREEAERPVPAKTGDELMLFVGQTIVNSPQDQKGVASGIEFRKGLLRHVDWTLTWLNEGDPQVVRRNGLGSQLWLVDAYLDNRLAVGAGLGGYYFVDRKRPPQPGRDATRDLGYLLSLTASWRFPRHWFARFNWNRVLVDYNRDSDVFVLGVGYRLGG